MRLYVWQLSILAAISLEIVCVFHSVKRLLLLLLLFVLSKIPQEDLKQFAYSGHATRYRAHAFNTFFHMGWLTKFQFAVRTNFGFLAFMIRARNISKGFEGTFGVRKRARGRAETRILIMTRYRRCN